MKTSIKRIRVIDSIPVDNQEGVENLIGEEFNIVPYRDFDKYTREEMKELGEVAIIENGSQLILNKGEYEFI